MGIIRDYLNNQVHEPRKQSALAAALVHDVGHGPFSHAFEDVGKRLQLPMAKHENVSDALIRDSEISEELAKYFSDFPNEVANVVKRGGPSDIYDAVVSSQFDADRLDYMQRDRMMTGVQSGSIDFEWLMNNLEIGKVVDQVDEERSGEIETFVLGPKAGFAAETYILSLFQMYPTVYFHKATRGAEKLFSELLEALFIEVFESRIDNTGLTSSHPLVKFALDPKTVENWLKLDDAVVWGALPMLEHASCKRISRAAERLRKRKLLKCIDIRDLVVHSLFPDKRAAQQFSREEEAAIGRTLLDVGSRIQDWVKDNSFGERRILIDQQERHPYKRFQESKGPLNQIRIRLSDDQIVDMAEQSAVVAALAPYRLFRVYVDESDEQAVEFAEKAVRDAAATEEGRDVEREP